MSGKKYPKMSEVVGKTSDEQEKFSWTSLVKPHCNIRQKTTERLMKIVGTRGSL